MTTLLAPTRPSAARVRRDWVDRLRAYDPGGLRLRLALQTVVTMLAAIGAEWVFVKLTHALEIPGVPAQNHGVLVVSLMIGAIVANCGAFAVPMLDSPEKRALNLALVPIPMVAGFAAGLALAPHRIWSFVAVVVVLSGGAYLRRFGVRGFFGGIFGFIGTFFGIFLHGLITISAIGWLAAEVCLAVAVTIALQLSIFRARDDVSLARLRRSFGARSRAVAAAALELTVTPPGRRRERLVRLLRRRILRFNETALMVDAGLERPGALPGGVSPGYVHQRLFDLELAVANMARFTVFLSEKPDTPDAVRDGLAAVGDLDPELAERAAHELAAWEGDRDVRIVVHRFAGCLRTYADALTGLRDAQAGRPHGEDVEFTAAAELTAGWLPGTATVSKTASEERRGMPPNVRIAIQMGVAVTVALILGFGVDQKRWYWAVVAAFVTFMGAHNAGEQLRKGSLRVVGTVIGVLLGAVLAHLVGTHVTAALVVIMSALFVGTYLMRSSYVWLVIAITVALSQLYVELGTFSDGLLLLRLGETALGAGVALLTVLLVLPLRTGRVVRVATREYLTALDELVDAARQRMIGQDEDPNAVRVAARKLDASYQALMAGMAASGVPLLPASSNRILYANSLSASRNYARNLHADASAFPSDRTQALDFAVETLRGSIEVLVSRLQGGESPEPYVRSASLFETLAEGQSLPDLLALIDLQLLDESLAVLAEQVGLPVTALDVQASSGVSMSK